MVLEDIADRAAAYGMPGVVVDGNDVEAVAAVTAEAVARARAGEGPTLIEAKTYRHRGHFEGDMGAYRPEGELEYWMERDPIDLYDKRLKEEFGVSDEDIETVRKHVETTLDEAVEWAEKQPHPEPADALKHVYVDDYEGAALR